MTMNTNEIIFTECDRAIMDSYSKMLDGLAEYYGNGYEFVLHSLEDLDHSAIRVLNSHTGRREGAPITELALTMLEEIKNQRHGDAVCYHTTNPDGKPLYSSTIAIRGEGGRIIGVLCINYYLDTPISDILNLWAPSSNYPVVENYVQDSNDLVLGSVKRICEEVNRENIPVSLRNKEIVSRLYDQGIFNIKEAPNIVAQFLQISKNTVYLHIRNRRESRKA
jgi:predicted transcriptional regulator YheO